MTTSILLTAAEPVRAASSTERNRAWRKRNPGYDRSKDLERDYLSRPFVAWDGEGITGNDGIHRYVMLAVRDADGYNNDYVNPDGIGTYHALDFIHYVAQQVPKNAIHTMYGAGYDFNMILRDLPRQTLDRLYHGSFTRWDDFKLAWRPGKSLWIARLDPRTGKRVGRAVTIFDVVPFFQCAFVRACDDYLGSRFVHREMIVENKALRSSFTESDIPEVRRYNDAELVNLLALMQELRARLNAVGLRPRRWDGPGAIASELLRREGVKKAQTLCPEPVAEAARYAYAGGRFEVIKYGKHNGTAYEYDVNSAYPAALQHVPDLNDGTWVYHENDPGNLPFAMYHVRYSGTRRDIPGAFFRRNPKGTVCYPMNVTGWYWSPEVATGREYCDRGYGSMEILEVWEYRANDEARKPFDFIPPLYRERKALKAAGDGAHVGIKLGLNSLYGKLAQQVGAKQDAATGDWRLPPFHQLEWAGYTTSYCRARVLSAVLDNLDSVIAFETDAVFTTVPLNVPHDDELGSFEAIRFDNLTYVQSGMYFGEIDGKQIAKTRGVDRGTLTRDDVETRMHAPFSDDRTATATLTRFVGAGIALAQNMARWRKWERVTKTLTLEPAGKRVHLCECQKPRPGRRAGEPLREGLHDTFCPMLDDAHSCQFPILWENPNPDMSELAELREQERMDWE